MSCYDSRSADPASYRDRRGNSSLGSCLSSSSVKREQDGGAKSLPLQSNLDGLTPFEKNFCVEPSSVATMSESEVDEYGLRREITVDGKDVPRPIKSFDDAGFPDSTEKDTRANHGVLVRYPRSRTKRNGCCHLLRCNTILFVLEKKSAPKMLTRFYPLKGEFLDMAIHLPNQLLKFVEQ